MVELISLFEVTCAHCNAVNASAIFEMWTLQPLIRALEMIDLDPLYLYCLMYHRQSGTEYLMISK